MLIWFPEWVSFEQPPFMKKVVFSSLICVFLFFVAIISLLTIQRWKTKPAESDNSTTQQTVNRQHP